LNAHLLLTKYRSRHKDSSLYQIAANNEGGSRSSLLQNIKKQYEDAFKTMPEWYLFRYEQHYMTHNEQDQQLDIRCKSTFITGQGQPSVAETHFALHPIYGFPFLPGTMLKGAAAHYCHQHLGKQDSAFKEGGDYYIMLFGSQEQSAGIHYHDAWPTPSSIGKALCLDVLTPHHQAYNSQQPDRELKERTGIDMISSPRDDDSPVPIPFLSTTGTYRILLTAEQGREDSDGWLEIAMKLVQEVAATEGLGGKTNSGYGRFGV